MQNDKYYFYSAKSRKLGHYCGYFTKKRSIIWQLVPKRMLDFAMNQRLDCICRIKSTEEHLTNSKPRVE